MRRRTSWQAWIGLAAAGCSAGGSASPPPVVVDASSPPACLPTSACVGTARADQRCVTTLGATVVDPAGAPVAGLPVYVCGTDLCTEPSRTGADGSVEVQACLPIANPALKVFSDPQWAPFAALLDGSGPSFALGRGDGRPIACHPAFPFPRDSPRAASRPAAWRRPALRPTRSPSTSFTRTPPRSRFAPSPFPRPSSQDRWPDPSPQRGRWRPSTRSSSPPAQVTLPNAPGWPAGTLVDVFLDGTDAATLTPPAPWGTWGPIGSATVSADGQSIVVPALSEIGMIGIRMH